MEVKFVWNLEKNKKANLINIRQFAIVPAKDEVTDKKWTVIAFASGGILVLYHSNSKTDCEHFVDFLTEQKE